MTIFFLWVLRLKEILGCIVGHSYIIRVAVIVIGRLACIILESSAEVSVCLFTVH